MLAALLLGVFAEPVSAQATLQLRQPDGRVLHEVDWPESAEICLRWSHSVTGGPVADCFENRIGILTLTRSYLHDFAAGLGEVAGRGTLVSAAGGGYWIEGMDEPLVDNRLALRTGSAGVGHRLTGFGPPFILPQRMRVEMVLTSGP